MEMCFSCRFWKEISPPIEGDDWPENHHFAGFGSMGQCRRMPPQIDHSPLLQYPHSRNEEVEYNLWLASQFPITPAGIWCGEFAEKAKITPI